MSETARKTFQYAIPVFGGIFMLAWPAGLQLTFCTTSLLAVIQATLFSSDRFRNLVGMQLKPKPNAPKKQHLQYQAPLSTPSKPTTGPGVIGTLKGAVSDLVKIGEQYAPKPKAKKASRLTDAEKRHAEKYEKRRQRELAAEEGLREEDQARLERKQEERAIREQERGARLQRRARLQRWAEKKARRNQ